MIRIYTTLFVLSVAVTFAVGQNLSDNIPFTKRMRVIIDNDFSGDPDGLFQLSHLCHHSGSTPYLSTPGRRYLVTGDFEPADTGYRQ